MASQFECFLSDYRRNAGKRPLRMLYIWMSPTIMGIFFYRLDRGLYLVFGRAWKFIRILFLPVFHLIHIISRLDIHYSSDIGKGLMILHSSLGVVISGKAIIGNDLTLTGGNCIGVNDRKGEFRIGHNFKMGANASVIGPCILGDNISVGAGAVVTKNFPDNVTLIGIPAQIPGSAAS
jgi:serine O-acetyltransferase